MKTNNTRITLKSIDEKINESMKYTERSFRSLENIVRTEVGGLNNKIDQANDGLVQQIQSVNNRLDDVITNKVSYGEFEKLEKRVDRIEKR